jgi:hypothetical protein
LKDAVAIKSVSGWPDHRDQVVEMVDYAFHVSYKKMTLSFKGKIGKFNLIILDL